MSELVPPTQVVALGYSIVGSISDKAQITFHHAIADDETDADVNARLDRIMSFIDRQVAKYEVPALMKELRDLEDMNAQSAEDMANSENNFLRAQADLDVQIGTLQTAMKKTHDTSIAQHRASGRGGDYKPRGTTQVELDRAKAGIDAAIEAKNRNEEERKQFLQNIGISNTRREVRVGIIKARLAEINQLVG